MLVGLWLTPFYLHSLGQRGYGLWLVGLQVLTIVSLMDFGVVAILPRDIAQLSGKVGRTAGWGELEGLVAQTTKIVRWQTLIVTAVSLGAYFSWPGVAPEIRGPLGIAIGAFCVTFPFRMYAATLEGLQDLQFLSQLRIVVWAVVTATVVVLLMCKWGLYALAIGSAVNGLGFQVAALIRLRMKYPSLVNARHWVQGARIGWRDLTRGSWLSLGQVSQILLDGTYLLAVAKIMGPAAVVTFTCTGKLVTVLANQPQLFVLSALPGLSQMKTSASKERLRGVTTVLGQGMVILSGAIVCVTLSLNEAFVRVWVGPQLFGGKLLTGLILAAMLLRHLDLALGQALFAMNHERAMSIKALVDGSVVTASAFVSIHWLGLYGAALAQLLGIVLVSLPTDIRLFSREFGVKAQDALLPFVPYLWRLAIACGAGLLLARWLQPHTYFAIGELAAGLLSFYFALVLPYAWRTPIGGYIQSALAHFRISILNRSQAVEEAALVEAVTSVPPE